MYHVVGTGLTTLLLYLISYSFYRFGFYSQQFHRKLWNTILASVFLMTAFAGLFMALQITYKWNIPFIKSILKWHVETGIGMTLTGLFHFIWHLPYYGIFNYKTTKIDTIQKSEELKPGEISINLFILGFISSSIQFLLLREIMNISGGYELISGTFLGSWLIGSAMGSYFASKSSLNNLKKINLIFALTPFISILLLLFLSRMFLNPGETPSFLLSMIFTFIVLIPFCLVSGFTFIKLVSAAKSANGFFAGKSFAIETAGGVFAGGIIALLTAGYFNSYQLILLIITLSVAYVVLTFYSPAHKKIYIKLIFFVLTSAIILLNPDLIFRQILLRGIKVTDTKDTPYGNITLGEYRGEKSLYYNQRLLAYKDDIIESEENIHYALLQCEFPEKVIIVSGSLPSLLPQLEKYSLKKITYIEMDPALVNRSMQSAGSTTAELTIENKDAFRYIKSSHELMDAIILLLPPPSTLLLNRYYTTDFFKEIKGSLISGGTFMCSPGPGDNYLNKESIGIYSSVYNGLISIFKYVKPILGNKMYFVASDKEISLSYCHLTELRNIKNIYVNSDYLDDNNIIKRSNEVVSLINHGIRQNSSTFPVACFHFQSYNLSRNPGEKLPVIIILITAFMLQLLIIKRGNLLMYFSASALAGFEIIILLIVQLIFGNMYQVTSLVVAGLMTGLAIGSGYNFRMLNSFSLRIKGTFLLIFYTGFGLIYHYFIAIKGELPEFGLILITTFLPAILTGHLFRELTLQTDTSRTSSVYSSDLAGSAFGFILLSGFAVPALGIQNSIFLISTLILSGILFGTIRNK
jgi:spermidine synthase